MADGETTIRLAAPEDAAMLAELGARAFSETFSKDNTPEDMADYLRQNFSPEKQSAELAQPGSLFLVLEVDRTPVGFTRLVDNATDACLANSADWRHLHPMELVRIYLLQAWTGRRLGDRMMQACIDHARSRDVEALWLGVWEHNTRAISFYKRWGFEVVGTHPFPLGRDLQTDFIMARKISTSK